MLALERRSNASSASGGTREPREMLDSCRKHNIVADVEVIAQSQIDAAFERLEKGDLKYRFVIDMSLA
jgi:uncharacterized zinc-type alcohol dehydrogenase-like protein